MHDDDHAQPEIEQRKYRYVINEAAINELAVTESYAAKEAKRERHAGRDGFLSGLWRLAVQLNVM